MRATAEQVSRLWAALDAILAPRRGEPTLITYDQHTREVFETFRSALAIGGVDARGFELPGPRPRKELPPELLELLDRLRPILCFNHLFGYPEETPMRIALFHRQEELGARIGHSPDVTMEMVLGPMLADVPWMRERGRRLMRAMDGVSDVEVTAPAGTSATFSLVDRSPRWDLELRPGQMGNLPAGETWWAPVEESMDGVLVVDGSIGDIKRLYPPLAVEVQEGRVVSMRCEDPSLPALLRPLLSVDDQADLLGELGVGLNPLARISGLLLEDEKALRTLHFAFGHNTDMPGGRNASKTHRDFIIRRPTLVRLDTDEMVIRDGEVL